VDWEKEDDDNCHNDVADDCDDPFDDDAFTEQLAEMAAKEDDKHDEWLPCHLRKAKKPTGERECNFIAILI
jgi:hypothetical protein